MSDRPVVMLALRINLRLAGPAGEGNRRPPDNV
jgi:hypothetical protein